LALLHTGVAKVPVCNECCSRGCSLDGVEMQRGGAPMTWGEIGQLMSGTGVLMTSLCAGVTVTLVSLHQKRKQWVDDFRALYAEFWNDKDISQVRGGS
jgi:hypothetical protein